MLRLFFLGLGFATGAPASQKGPLNLGIGWGALENTDDDLASSYKGPHEGSAVRIFKKGKSDGSEESTPQPHTSP